MRLYILLGTIAFGFLLGCIQSTALVSTITAVFAAVGVILRPRGDYELSRLIAMGVWITLGLSTLTMWGTHIYYY